MSTIENTVQSALREAGHGDYIRYADQPIGRLLEREREIAAGIIEAAAENNIDREDTRELLTRLGMTVPVEEQVEDPEAFGSTSDVEGTLAQIQQTLQAILRAAADNGITIRV